MNLKGGHMAESELLRAYLAVGPDEVKRDMSVSRLKRRLEDSGMADFNLDERDLGEDQDVEALVSSLNMYPMGADFRLVILHAADKAPEPVRGALIDYLGNPSPTTVLLLTAKSLARNTKLYKAVAGQGARAIIDCGAKKGRDLPVLVQGMARRYGKELSLSAAEELVSRAGEQTRMLDNELKKLASMVEGPAIAREDVEAHVARTAEVKPWDFLNAVSARDLPRALELYRLQPPRSEMRLFSLLLSRIRELICAKALDARGRGRDLAEVLGMQGWQVRNHMRWSRAFTCDELVSFLSEAVEVEQALKGSRDGAGVFVMWVSHIAGKRP